LKYTFGSGGEASIYVDRRGAGPVGRTPFSGFLLPGAHTIIVEREGYVAVQRTVTIERGQPHRVELALSLVPHGWISVEVNAPARGARVLLDGAEACRAPCRLEAAPGDHKIAIEQPGLKRYRGLVRVERATETQLAARLSPAPSRISAYVSLTFSAALLGAGLYFGLKSRSEYNDLNRQVTAGRPLLASDDPRLSAGWTHAVAADALFGLGAVTALLGVYYAVRSPGADSRVETTTRSFVVQPVATPGGVGVVGRF